MGEFLDLQDSWRERSLSSALGQGWVRYCKVTIPFLMVLSGVSGCQAGGGNSTTIPLGISPLTFTKVSYYFFPLCFYKTPVTSL